MLDRKRLSVHRVGQRRLGVAGLTQAQASFEANRRGSTAYSAAVGAAEQQVPGAEVDAGAVQDRGQWKAGPLGGAHRAQPPLLTLGAGIE